MRLIDADNAIHALGVFSDMEHGNKHFLNGINSAKEIINECVTISAVPVVRCRECKHNRNCFIKEMIIAETKQDNPYCSCGAKMEDKPC